MKNHLQDISHEMPIKQKLLWARIFFVVIVFTGILSSCTLIKTRVYRVGIISGTDAFLGIADGYKNRMTELGYIEGKNIEYDYWKLNDNPDEEKRILRKFVDEKVDLIFTFPTRPSIQAKAATQGTDIPVVFASATIEGTDLVTNLREPGGNITGVRFPLPETTAKKLELLLELAPDVHRIFIIYTLNYPNYPATRAAIDKVAADENLTLIENPVTSIDGIKSGFEALEKQPDIGIDAIFQMPDLINGTVAAWEIIKPFAIKHNLPVSCNADFQLKDACLFMLYSDHNQIGGLAADMTNKILHGTAPGSIPVVSPNMNLYLNYRRAQELGLNVPDGLLKQAYIVIR